MGEGRGERGEGIKTQYNRNQKIDQTVKTIKSEKLYHTKKEAKNSLNVKGQLKDIAMKKRLSAAEKKQESKVENKQSELIQAVCKKAPRPSESRSMSRAF